MVWRPSKKCLCAGFSSADRFAFGVLENLLKRLAYRLRTKVMNPLEQVDFCF